MNADVQSWHWKILAAIIIAATGVYVLIKAYLSTTQGAREPRISSKSGGWKACLFENHRREDNTTRIAYAPMETYDPNVAQKDMLDWSAERGARTMPAADSSDGQGVVVVTEVSEDDLGRGRSSHSCLEFESHAPLVVTQERSPESRQMQMSGALGTPELAAHKSRMIRKETGRRAPRRRLNLWTANKSQVFARYRSAPRQCHLAPSTLRDRRRHKNRLRIANYNVDWFFYFGGAGTLNHTCPGRCTWRTAGQAWNHIRDIASAVQELDADIIHFTEVEDCRVLRILCDLLGTDYRPYLILGIDKLLHQNVGFISKVDPVSDLVRLGGSMKFPVPGSRCTPARGTCSLSKNYLAKLRIANRAGKSVRLVLGGAHFRAGKNNAGCLRREAQAAILAEGVGRRLTRGSHVVLVGDYNDRDRRLPQLSAQNCTVSGALEILSTGTGRHLFNPLVKAPPGNCYTQREKSALDHILVDPALRIAWARVHHGAGARTRRNARVSDHYPVVADIDLR